MSERKPTIYVITYYEFNHVAPRPGGVKPLDKRFTEGSGNYVYYLIDKEVPAILKDKKTLLECDIDPLLHKAGGKHLGEWSFLLAEEKHGFCEYPFFMISSRFYEKNGWLPTDLNKEWDKLFSHLEKYGYGYLPSYDRPLRWIDLSWEKQIKQKAWEYTFFPFKPETYQLTEEIFGVNIPKDYRYTADLFCNYIGFNTRQDLLDYVAFYKPLINYFFDENQEAKVDVQKYIRNTNTFRNEKSFTFFLELLCHLFFFKTKKSYFALHYDGYYSINESTKKMQKLTRLYKPLKKLIRHHLGWQWRRMQSEGFLAPLRVKLKEIFS